MKRDRLVYYKSVYGSQCVKMINDWVYCVGAGKDDEENWGLDIYNSEDELICTLLHKSFDSFKNDEDMERYVCDYINEYVY